MTKLPFSIGNVEDRMMQFADANGIELASHELYMSEGNQAARSNCSSSRRCHRSSHRGSTWLLLSRCKDKHFFRYLHVFINLFSISFCYYYKNFDLIAEEPFVLTLLNHENKVSQGL